MYSLPILLGFALGLACFFIEPSLVRSFCLPLNDNDRNELLHCHNAFRSLVQPQAANMRQMYWSDELAAIAAESACMCNFQEADIPPRPFKNHFARENHIYSTENNLGDMTRHWFEEYVHYNFSTRECAEGQICEHYINIAWARACEVGCALSTCRLEDIYKNRVTAPGEPALVEGQGTNLEDYVFFLACAYGAGFPGTANLLGIRPYWAGTPCSECPTPRFPVCQPRIDNSGIIDLDSILTKQTGIKPNLCYNNEMACIGSDPHFAIRLFGGALLCYTFQGQHNATFNLVSNDQLQMNALFVPDDTDYDNTWLGSIGVSVLHDGKKTTTLQFTAADQLVKIGGRVALDAKTIKKLTFNDGKLTMLRVPSNSTRSHPRIRVEFIDSGLEFTIKFAKNHHLDLHWYNTREPSKKSGGVLGQFFRNGVKIDEEAETLHIPGRPPVPVKQQDLWKFMEQTFQTQSKCWTMEYHSNQGAGLVAGTYQDYIVQDLLSVVGH